METVSVDTSRQPATLTVFAYDERPWLNCVRSLIATKAVWPSLEIWDSSKDALISRTRSTQATRFLEQGAGDVLVMIDHDIGWEPGDLEHLVGVCRDRRGVVGGVYPKRGFGAGIASRLPVGVAATIGTNAVLEVDYAATGFMAIHRDVLAALAEKLPLTIHGFRAFFETQNEVRPDGSVEYLSEDWDFCRKVLNAGFTVWLDLLPTLTHMGTHQFRIQDTTWAPPFDRRPVTLRGISGTEPMEVRDCFGEPMQFYVDPDDSVISGTLVRGGTHDPEVMEELKRELRPDDRVFELGANVGYHTVQIAKLLEDGALVAVEPMPHLAEILRKNVDLAECSDRVATVEQAVTREAGKAAMFRDYRNPGSSHLTMEGIDVEACTLAGLVAKYGQPDIIKVDIEGAEGLAFDTPESRAILAKTRYIVIEYCEDVVRRTSGISGREYIEMLESCGFERTFEFEELPAGVSYCNIGMRNARVG